MSSLASVRRTRTALMLAASLVVVVAIGGLLYAGALALVRYEGGKDRTVDAEPIPVTPVGMLASVDDSDQLTGVTIWVLNEDQVIDGEPARTPGGSIVSVPISSDILGGVDGQRQSLAEAYADGGADALLLAVESLLSLTVDQSMVATPTELAELLQPVAPVDVVLPDDVVTTDDGAEVTLYAAGEASLSAGQMAKLLNAKADGQTEADRRPNILAAWKGVVAAIGDGRTDPSPLTPTSLGQLVGQVYSGPADSRGIVAGPLPDPIESDRDVEQLDRADAVLVFATIAPSNMSAASTGLTFRIEAPPGHEDKVKWAVEALLYLGGNVGWVKQDGPEQPTTKVLLSDLSLSDDALGAENLFGSDFEQLEAGNRIEGIDVIIQLGTTFLDDPNTGIALPSTTTTTTVP